MVLVVKAGRVGCRQFKELKEKRIAYIGGFFVDKIKRRGRIKVNNSPLNFIPMKKYFFALLVAVCSLQYAGAQTVAHSDGVTTTKTSASFFLRKTDNVFTVPTGQYQLLDLIQKLGIDAKSTIRFNDCDCSHSTEKKLHLFYLQGDPLADYAEKEIVESVQELYRPATLCEVLTFFVSRNGTSFGLPPHRNTFVLNDSPWNDKALSSGWRISFIGDTAGNIHALSGADMFSVGSYYFFVQTREVL